MTGPALDPVADYLAAKKSVGGDPVAEYTRARDAAKADGTRQLLTDAGIIQTRNKAQKLHDEYASGNLARRMETENMVEAAEAADEPSYAQRALGGIASLLKHAPFAEKTAAVGRTALRGENYDEALSNIRQGQASAPKGVQALNSALGGVVSAAAIPGSPALSGARYGILEGLGDPDRMSSRERLTSSLKGGAIDALTGKALDVALTGARAAAAKPVDEAAITRRKARKQTDIENYGKVNAETATAAQAPTDPAVVSVMKLKEIEPIEKSVRASRKFAGADDYTVAREVFKRMSALERGLVQRIASKEYEPALETTLDDLRAAKADLASALDAPLPSLRPANAAHARMMGERGAFNEGADVGRRITKSSSLAAKNLETKSPAAFREKVPTMRPNEADAGREGMLSSVGESMGLTLNPKTGFGVGPSVAGPFKAAETLRALDSQANKGTFQHGLSFQDFLRSLGLVSNPLSQ